METKSQRRERLKAMRKKYHLGEFKNKRSHSIKSRSGGKMAKKRHSYAKKKSSSGTGYLVGTFLGSAGYLLFEGILEPKLASMIGNGMILNVAELAAGVYLARKGGWVGNIGKVAVVINTYQILQPYLAGIGANLFQ